MTKILNWVLGTFGFSLNQLIITAAVVVAAFFAGGVWQNGHATKAAVDVVQKAADARVDKQKAEDARKMADAKKAWEDARNGERAANQQGHDQLAKELTDAKAALTRARAKLKELDHAGYPPDSLIVGGADLRRLLNDATGACAGPDGMPPATDLFAGTDDRAAACRSSAGVRLDELEAGYLALGTQYRDVAGQLRAVETAARSLGLTADKSAAVPAR